MIRADRRSRPCPRFTRLAGIGFTALLLLSGPHPRCLAAPIGSFQVEVRLYQVFGELMGNQDYAGVVREADRIIESATTNTASREYAFFMKILALQSLERYREALETADRALAAIPQGTYTGSIRESRETSIGLIGTSALVEVRVANADDEFERVVELADRFLESEYVTGEVREEIARFRISALIELDRSDEALNSADRFLESRPESAFADEVRELRDQAARTIALRDRVLRPSSAVLSWRELWLHETVTPRRVNRLSGETEDPSPDRVLRDRLDPRYADGWGIGPEETTILSVELPAERPGTLLLGLQVPAVRGQTRLEKVPFEIFGAGGTGERKIGDFVLDRREGGIQCYPLPQLPPSERLHLHFHTDGVPNIRWALTGLYLIGPSRAAEIERRDDANRLRTRLPVFEIGERIMPGAGATFPAKRSLTRVDGSAYSDLRLISDELLLGLTHDEDIHLIEVDSGRLERRIAAPFYEITGLLADRIGHRVFLHYLDDNRRHRLAILDVPTGEIAVDPGLPRDPEPQALFIAPDTGDVVVTYHNDLELRSSDLREVRWRRSFGTLARSGRGLTAAFSSNGGTVAVGRPDGRILLLDRASGRITGELPGFGGHNNAVMALLFVHDDEVLLAASQVEIAAFSTLSARPLFRTQTILRDMHFADVDGEGRLLVGSDTGTYLVDLTAGTMLRNVARRWDGVAVSGGRINAIEADYLQRLEDSPRATFTAVADRRIPTGRWYDDGDDLWVFCPGEFRLEIGTSQMQCRDAFVLDEWTRVTTGWLRPASGEVIVTPAAGGEVTVLGGRPEAAHSRFLVNPAGADSRWVLSDTPGVGFIDPIPEYDYSAAEIRTLAGSAGAVENRLNIVLVGDGYTDADLAAGGSFDRMAAMVTEAFRETFPFSMFRDEINIFAVVLASKERGADDGPDRETRNTAFDATYFGYPDVERALIVQNETGLSEALARVPAYDLVGVIVNDERIGGTGEIGVGSYLFTASAGDLVGEIALHEAGHTLGMLADEYEDSGLAEIIELTPDFANVQAGSEIDFDDLAGTLKWRQFYARSGLEDLVGAWEGGFYAQHGVYRPQESCRMRTIGREYCVVCAFELYRALCRQTGRPVDPEVFLAAFIRARDERLQASPAENPGSPSPRPPATGGAVRDRPGRSEGPRRP